MAEKKIVDDLALKTFEHTWHQADEQGQLDLLEKASLLPPGLGVVPVLAGMDSYHFSVRNRARGVFSILRNRIVETASILKSGEDSGQHLDFIRETALFSARIYNVLKQTPPLQEIRFYLEILLECGGRGPYYAWRFCRSGAVSLPNLKNLLENLSEAGRLSMTSQFLDSPLSVRRHFALEFKRLLKGIRREVPVRGFLSDRFDLGKYADPFIFHLPEKLRDPLGLGLLVEESPDPRERASALKALAMVVPKTDPALLIRVLGSDGDAGVRRVVLKVVESSPVGTYPELFPYLYKMVTKFRSSQSLDAFKALVVTQSFPLYRLMDKIRDDASWLVPDILKEISSLSEMSFFFIRELAVNEDFYMDTNRDIYQALVLGMILKRPERILHILGHYDNHPKDSIRMGIFELVKNIDSCLSRERREMNTEFEELVLYHGGITKRSEKKGFFRQILASASPLEKKLRAVRRGEAAESLDFRGDILENEDLSSVSFPNTSMFNRTALRECDLSGANFPGTYFRKAVFFNTNMDGAVFEEVCFDGAVFINVSGVKTRFVNCSFKGAWIYDSKFEWAQIKDGIFVKAVISGTSFKGADLTGSTFVCSRLVSSTFENAVISLTDFSGMVATFTNFPSLALSEIEGEQADFNGRTFQFQPEDLPESLFHTMGIQDSFLSEIDLAVLSEFIYAGRLKFFRHNRLSLMKAYDIFRPRQTDFFEILPLLLHENIDFPGYPAGIEKPPCGIAGYLPSRETGLTVARYLDQSSLVLRAGMNCHIEGLFTIGSVGSIAQTLKSDIDYWVCIREESMDRRRAGKFEQKLRMLERWAQDDFKLEVHFFSMDIEKARVSDFGDSTIESSGSAQGRILKEEFYRTMTHVAGKLPFWCTLPVGVSRSCYDRLFANVSRNPETCRYLDLGDIHAIPPAEYFGASIWQLFKLLKSPFKSVIKMALLEKIISENGGKILLCNAFKDEWMNAGFQHNLEKSDAYYALISSLVEYYRGLGDQEDVNLVQLCFFMKTAITGPSDLENTLFGLRSFFINHCMEAWSWNRDKVFDAGNFRQWHYGRITKLSLSIEKYMIKTYKKVSRTLSGSSEEDSMITPEDRTVLGRKMFVQFSKHPGKVPKILLVSRSDRHFQGLNLRYDQQQDGGVGWELVHNPGFASRDKVENLQRTSTIEGIGAWLIHNSLYSKKTLINLVPNPTPVTHDDVKGLFGALHDFFGFEDKEVPSQALLSGAEITSMFVSMNLCIPRQTRRLTHFCVVYMNSWGEMYCRSIVHEQGVESMDGMRDLILKELDLTELPEKRNYYLPKFQNWDGI